MKINTYKSLILVFLISCGSTATQKSLPEIPQKEVIPQYVEPPQTKSEEDATVHIGDRLPVKGVTRKPISDKTFVIIVGAVIVLSIMAGGYIVSKNKGGNSEKVKAAADAVEASVVNAEPVANAVKELTLKKVPPSDTIASILEGAISGPFVDRETALIKAIGELSRVYSSEQIAVGFNKLKINKSLNPLKLNKKSIDVLDLLKEIKKSDMDNKFFTKLQTISGKLGMELNDLKDIIISILRTV